MNKEVCVTGQTILSGNEAGRIYFNLPGLLDETRFQLHRIGHDKFMFAHKDGSKECVFFNKEKQECMLGSFVPEVCGGSNPQEHKTFPLNNLSLVPEYDKKTMKKYHKTMKEDMLLYLATWHLTKHMNGECEIPTLGDVFKISYTYKLVRRKDNKMTTIRFIRLEAIDEDYKVAATIYNYLYKQVMMLPYDYIVVLLNKLNKLIKGGNFKDCDMDIDDVRKSAIYMVSLFRSYKLNYKVKSNRYKSISNDVETRPFLANINKKLGSDQMFKLDKLMCILENNDMMYRIIMKQK